MRQLRHGLVRRARARRRRPTSTTSPTRRTPTCSSSRTRRRRRPGLAFLLATIAEYGDDGWQPTTGSACATTVCEVVDGWTDAYYERVLGRRRRHQAARRQLRHRARRPRSSSPIRRSTRPRRRRRHDVLPPGRVRRHPARHRARRRGPPAHRLPAVETFQSELPLNLFVYPANADVELPDVFAANATVPADAGARSIRPTIDANRSAWIDEWTDAVADRRRTGCEPLPRPIVARPGGVPVAFLVVFYAWPFVDAAGDRAARRAPSATRSAVARRGGSRGSRSGRRVVSTAPHDRRRPGPGLRDRPVRVRRPRAAARRLLTAVFVLPTVVMGAAVLALLPDSLDRGVWADPARPRHLQPRRRRAHRRRGVGAPAARPGGTPRPRSAPRRGGRSDEVTLPLLRPRCSPPASIVFVFTFTSFGVDPRARRAPAPRRSRSRSGARRRSSATSAQRRRWPCCSSSCSALAVAWSSSRSSVVTAGRWPCGRHAGGAGRRRRGERWRSSAAVAAAHRVVAVAPLVALVERSLRGSGGRHSLDGVAHRSGGPRCAPGSASGIDPLGVDLRRRCARPSSRDAHRRRDRRARLPRHRRRRVAAADSSTPASMLPIATSAVTIGFGMLITFDQPPVDWRASWWLVPDRSGARGRPVRRAHRARRCCAASTPASSTPRRRSGASPSRAWRHDRPAPSAPAAGGGRRARGSDLARRVRRHQLPVPQSGRRRCRSRSISCSGGPATVLQAQGYVLATILAATTVAVVVLLDVTGDRRS